MTIRAPPQWQNFHTEAEPFDFITCFFYSLYDIIFSTINSNLVEIK